MPSFPRFLQLLVTGLILSDHAEAFFVSVGSSSVPLTSSAYQKSSSALHLDAHGNFHGEIKKAVNHNNPPSSTSAPSCTTNSSKPRGSNSGGSGSGGGDDKMKKSSSSTELSASFSATMEFDQPFKIFCDMDGVLVDFAFGVQQATNLHPSQVPKNIMWKKIAQQKSFFEHLPWTKDGQRLWNAIRPLGPNILTGVPSAKSSRIEKYKWCKRELGLDQLHHVDMAAGFTKHVCVNGNRPKEGVTNVITCWSNNKHYESGHRSVLIDDREDLGRTWEEKGGIFVHHIDTETTLQKLRSHGILCESFEESDDQN